MTPREEQIARETARMDVCLPNGGHEYVMGNEACIYCGEPFPVIARDYGRALMPARERDKVWVPNGTIAAASEYSNIVQAPSAEELKLEDIVRADLVIADGKILKNRFGSDRGILHTLQSYFG